MEMPTNPCVQSKPPQLSFEIFEVELRGFCVYRPSCGHFHGNANNSALKFSMVSCGHFGFRPPVGVWRPARDAGISMEMPTSRREINFPQPEMRGFCGRARPEKMRGFCVWPEMRGFVLFP